MNDSGPSQGQPVTAQNSLYKNLVRPEQISQFPFLAADKKLTFANGVKKLWDEIQQTSTDDNRHQVAVKKLKELSVSLSGQLKQWREQTGRRAEGAATILPPGPQGQTQPQTQPQTQTQTQVQPPIQQQAPQQPMTQNQTPMELPAHIKQRVESTPWFLPPNIQEGSEADSYRSEAKRRYGHALYSFEMARNNLKRLEDMAQQQALQPGGLSADLIENRKRLENQVNTNRQFIENLMRQQQANKAAAAQGSNSSQMIMPEDSSIPQQSSVQNPNPGQPVRPQIPGQVANGQVAPNPGFEAARQTSDRPLSSPLVPGQPHPNKTRASQPSALLQSSHAPFNSPRPQPKPSQQTPFTQDQQQSPQPTTPSVNMPTGVVPYTQQAAVAAAARTYSQAGSRQTPQPNNGRQANGQTLNSENPNKPQFPIPNSFVPQTPQPVSMGAARPTLTGANHGPMGMMGQPAIAKQPTFLLQGPGDRVLDKKKLDELVRQVTGGGEGAEGEGLLPEVEEVCTANLALLSVLVF